MTKVKRLQRKINLGLISDYLEENRERERLGCFDPCMIMGFRIQPEKNYKNIYKDLDLYSASGDEIEREEISQRLISQAVNLEQLKTGYLLADKVILEIINYAKLRSALLQSAICTIDEQLQHSYQSICGMIQEIENKLAKDKHRVLKQIDTDEYQIRMRLLSLIIGGVIQNLQTGSPLDTSGFRKVVKDCAELIRRFQRENYLQADKMVVKYYIEKHYGMKESQNLCRNCQKPLWKDIPYCLHCYERNA